MTTVMAIDAGKSSGVAVVYFARDCEPELMDLYQFSEDNYIAAATRLIELWEAYMPDITVVEQFDLRPHNQFVADLTPVKINAILDYNIVYPPPVWQTPAQAKGLVKDQTLKNLGKEFWPTGKTVGCKDANDARDALRHAVRYGVQVLNHAPTIRKAWPDVEV